MKSENSDTSTTSTSIKKKKNSSKSQRESCEILDIRGGIVGANDLKINVINLYSNRRNNVWLANNLRKENR